MKYECPKCEQELETEISICGYGSDPSDTCDVLVCKNKFCENYDKVVFDEGDISRMREDELTEAQIEDYLLEQAREGDLE